MSLDYTIPCIRGEHVFIDTGLVIRQWTSILGTTTDADSSAAEKNALEYTIKRCCICGQEIAVYTNQLQEHINQ